MDDEQAPEDRALEGMVIAGKYRVDHLLGSGGMGTVWSGEHVILRSRVAIKFIRASFAAKAEARRRFEIEARAAANVQSKHTVQVHDYGVTDAGLPYIVMEYLEGESLSEALIRRGPLPGPEVATIISQASRALQKAHAAGIVHRDLKPDNIFLATNVEESDENSLPYIVKIVDFGIAKLLQDPTGRDQPFGGPTQTGAVIGTPNFMSPEQLTIGGAPGALTDLWSLGACTFAAMTARIPFEGEVLGDIVLRVCVAPMPVPSQVNPQVPAGFDAWFARACHRDPSKRFKSAAELAESLLGVCGTVNGRDGMQIALLEEDRIQYALRPSTDRGDIIVSEPPRAMASKTALLAGLLLGLTSIFAVIGVLAWRDKLNSEEIAAAAELTAADGGTTDAGTPK